MAPNPIHFKIQNTPTIHKYIYTNQDFRKSKMFKFPQEYLDYISKLYNSYFVYFVNFASYLRPKIPPNPPNIVSTKIDHTSGKF